LKNIVLLLFFLSNVLFAQIVLTDEEKEFLNTHPIIKVHMEENYSPFSFRENEEFKGFSIDFANQVANKLGVKFEYSKNEPWAEAVAKLKNKKIDIIAQMINNVERRKFALFSDNYMSYYQSIVVREENTHLDTLEKLNGKTVGVVKGYATDKPLKKHFPNIDLKYYKDTKDIVLAVMKREIDAAISTHQVVQYTIISEYINDVISIPMTNNKYMLQIDEAYGIRDDYKLLQSSIQKAFKALQIEKKELQIKWFGATASTNEAIDKNMLLSKKEKEYLKIKKHITMCIDPNWMPFESFDKSGKYIGMTADYYKYFEEILDTKFKPIKTTSWNETLQKAKNKECDIISLAMETPQRKQYLNFTKPYLEAPLVVVTKLDVPFINDINDLKNKKVAITKGYAFVELLKNKYPFLNIIEVDNINDGFNKVNNQQLDVFIGTFPSVGYSLQLGHQGELKIAGKLEEKWELGIGVRNDDKLLLTILDKAINNLNINHKREILNKWISVKYEKGIDYTLVWKIILAFLIIIIIIFYFYLKEQNLKRIIEKQKKGFETFFENSSDGILIIKNNHFVQCNQKAVQMLHYNNKSELLNTHPSELSPKIQPDGKNSSQKANEMIAVALKNKAHQFEWVHTKANGEDFWVEISLTPMTLDNDEVIHVTWRDISDKKKNEEIIVQQAKMSALGEMLGNIAHQWRQPLSVITTSVSAVLLEKELGMLNDEKLKSYMDGALNNAEYLSNTIETFTDFIKGENKKEKVQVCKLLDDSTALVKDVLTDNNIKFQNTIHCSEDCGKRVFLSQNEFTQVIINILNNAKDIILERNIKDGHIILDHSFIDNNVVITIEDNGGGIPEDVLPKIFEPYFTTKHQSQGTGLGLHMSYNIIVESFKGKIWAQNSKNGAKFYIELPLIN
jgi:PAS domain S-box-containing protein